MNDFELFKAMNEAEKKYNELRDEFRKRGLHKKPYCEFSHIEYGSDDHLLLKEMRENTDTEGRE